MPTALETNTRFEIRPIAGSIGAELMGMDIGRGLDDDMIEQLRAAIRDHLVVFIRDQDISPEQHLALGRRLGKVEPQPLAPALPGYPEIQVVRADKAHRFKANFWHMDMSYLEKPPSITILLAREVPPYGGDTMWTNLYLAYDDLSPNMKRYLEGLQAIHSSKAARYEVIQGDSITPEKKAAIQAIQNAMRDVLHPVVRTNPETGRKALFLNQPLVQRIKGVPLAESQAILDYLNKHITRPEYTCRFQWRKNSIGIWDNRYTQHYAVADYGDGLRIMHRVEVEGDRPA